MSKNTVSAGVDRTLTPVPKPAPKPEPPASDPIPVKNTVCPKCKATQEKDVAFCRFCGTPINNSETVPAPESVLIPGSTLTSKPVPKTKDGKVMCPYCGARYAVGTTNCKYCGTAITGTSTTKTEPVLAEDPISAAVYNPASKNKEERKAVCPHCGARQSDDVINCKYCGTPMYS